VNRNTGFAPDAYDFFNRTKQANCVRAFSALVVRPSGLVRIRGETEAYGGYEFFVPADGDLLAVEFFDPRTRGYAVVYPSVTSVTRQFLPRPVLVLL